MANKDNSNYDDLTPDELEDQPEIMVLTDEDGNEEEFEYLTIIPYEGEEYIILLPITETGKEEGEVVILRIEPIPGNSQEENYVDVEDDETLEAVFNLFREWYSDEYDFIENDDGEEEEEKKD